jgi:3-hydroxybutyryl-CoA dehydrogenase
VKVGVVGLGTMGAGIAQISLQAGHDTVGREVSPELGERGRATIERYLTRGVEKGRMSQNERDAALARLSLTTELADLADCDLVIEAVLEELDLKRQVFAELDRVTRPDAVLATNTSALSVSEIAEATEHPERVVGMHFFNPAPVLPLVEVVRTAKSSDAAVDTAYDWAEQAGKQPVRCNDTPGFIVNRILIPLLNDCVRVLDEADVPPEDLDKAMTNGAGWPLGPCALIDLIGIDVHVHASEALHGKLGEPRVAAPERLVRMQHEGRLGRKSGQGFYTY